MPNALEVHYCTPQPEDIQAIRDCMRELVSGTDRRPTKRGSRRFWGGNTTAEGSAEPPIISTVQWAKIAPFIATRDGRAWRRLPDLRKRIRRWEEYLDSQARKEYWPTFLFDACCSLPEEIPQQRYSKQQRQRCRAAIAAALADAPLLPAIKQLTCRLPSDNEYASGYRYRDIALPIGGSPPAWFSYRRTADLAAEGKAPDERNWVTPGLMKVVDPQYAERWRTVVRRWRDRHPYDDMVSFICDDVTREKTPDERARLAGALMCAAKAAVWHRACDYLLAYGRSSETSLSPAERRAAFIKPSWLEVHSDDSHLEAMLRSTTAKPPGQKNTRAQGDQQIAAALELAADDLAVENLLEINPLHGSDGWDAQLAAEAILDQLVIFLRQSDDLCELLFHRTVAPKPQLLTINPPPQAAPKTTETSESLSPIARPIERWLDHLHDLASGRSLGVGALRWAHDPANTQAVMHYLRSGDHPDRAKLTLGLLEALTTSISSPTSPDPAVLRTQMLVVNSAAWDVAAANDPKIFRFSKPLLHAVRPIDSPFVGTLYRCHATLATKTKQHQVAFNQIVRASHAIRAAGEVVTRIGEIERVNYVEALQQVTLQRAGAEIRALESFLVSPRHESSTSMTQVRELDRYADRLSVACTQDAHFAYRCLAELEQDPLPAAPQMGRVSTAAWRFNTRFQAARASILRGLVQMAEEKPGEAARSAPTLDVAAEYYKEAIAVARTSAQICHLTQAALTYALITGGKYLDPGNSVSGRIPAHMARPWADDLFDLDAASAYLLSHKFNAGPMINLKWFRGLQMMRREGLKEVYWAWRRQWADAFSEFSQIDRSNRWR